jgi:hypothetical protein
LEDPRNNRQLLLIGSTHASEMLALRTKKLIAEEKPDSLFVQTNQNWYNIASTLKGITGQAELNKYNDVLVDSYSWSRSNNYRGALFKLRLYSLLLILNAVKSIFHVSQYKKAFG